MYFILICFGVFIMCLLKKNYVPGFTASIYWLSLSNRKSIVLEAGRLLCNANEVALAKVLYS
jgi:hypothetical protein